METLRYFYHPDLSIRRSIDPLSDKYPNLTPYAYCANNPIILVAPEGYGNYLQIEIYDVEENPTSTYAFYAHLSEIKMKLGQSVKEGDEVGLTGNTGNAKKMKGESQHLHFEYKTKRAIKKGLDGSDNPNKIVDTKFEPNPIGKEKLKK